MAGQITEQGSELVAQLSRNSTPYIDPLSRIDWDSLSHDSWWLPEEAISLYGVPEYMALPEKQRRQLSHYEFLHLTEAGLWLEAIFMERISCSVKNSKGNTAKLIYHLHELREEAGHSLMFLELIQRSGLQRPPTEFYRMRFANWLARYMPFESAIFWMAVQIGEEIPDRMNRFIRTHADGLCQTTYDITKIHIIEEARHIAHAKEMVAHALRVMPAWQRRIFSLATKKLFRQFVSAFYYPQAGMYELAGLTPGHDWAKMAKNNPRRKQFVDACLQTALKELREQRLIMDWK